MVNGGIKSSRGKWEKKAGGGGGCCWAEETLIARAWKITGNWSLGLTRRSGV